MTDTIIPKLRQLLAKDQLRLEQIINREAIGTDQPLKIQVGRHGATRLYFATYANGVVTFDKPKK